VPALNFDIIARDRASKVFDQIGSKSAKTEQNLSKLGSGSSAIFGKITGAVAGVVTGWQAWDKVMVGGFSRLANLDDVRKRLDQMGISTSDAAMLMDGLKGTVEGTAFSLDEGASTMAKFVSAGVDLDEVNDRLEMTADTAAFAQAPLAEIGEIFTDIQTQGKLTGEELRMLQERGVPALQLLADAAGVSAEAMQAMISEGAVDAERFFDLWEQGSKGFGENNIKIEGAAKSMGDTIRGSLKNAEIALAKIGEEILDDFVPAIKEGADAFKDFANVAVEALDEVDQFAEQTGLEKAKEKIKEFNVTGAEFFEMLGESAEKSNDVIQDFFREAFGVENVSLMTVMADEAEVTAKTFSSAMDGAKSSAEGMADALGEQASQAQIASDTLSAYLETVARSTDPVLALSGALEDVDAAQAAYTESVAEYGEKSPEAESAALKLAGAVSKAEAAAINGDLSFDAFEGKLRQWVAQGAITAGQAETIRGRVADLRGEAEDFAGTYKATLDLKTQGLNTWINAKAWLDSIKSKTVTITAHAQLPAGVTTRQIMEGRQHGGPVKAGDPYWVAENSNKPELFIPDRPGLIVSNKDVKSLMTHGPAAMAGQPSSATVVEIRSGGSRLDDLLVEVLRKSIRVKGGSVQAVLGS
jgi:tape measure domain-containing protein